jgi:hypothetical protein
MAFTLPSHTSTQIPQKYRPSQIPYVQRSRHSFSKGGRRSYPAKSLIISLEDAAANWYSRLPPGYNHSWKRLKEKLLLNFQGFQVELDMEEDFLSCAQKKETLPNFYRRFLLLKAQSPEVSDDQVIA